jgi:TolA-binding protein
MDALCKKKIHRMAGENLLPIGGGRYRCRACYVEVHRRNAQVRALEIGSIKAMPLNGLLDQIRRLEGELERATTSLDKMQSLAERQKLGNDRRIRKAEARLKTIATYIEAVSKEYRRRSDANPDQVAF